MSPDEPYPSTAECTRRFLRLAGRSTLAVAATLLLYSSISLIARGTPPDEWFRLTTLNIPLSVIGGLPFGTLLAGLAMFRYRDTRLNLTALRRTMAAAAWVGAAAAVPMLGVYGWLFPGFDRANLAVVVKGSSTPYWSELGSDTTDAILWMPGPRWALRGREIGYTDPFVSRAAGRWPYASLHYMLVAAHRLPPVDELVRRCIDGEGRAGRNRPASILPWATGCQLRPLGESGRDVFAFLQLWNYEYGRLRQRYWIEEVRNARSSVDLSKPPADLEERGRVVRQLRERAKRRTDEEWRARHGAPFDLAAFEPEVREVVSRYRAAAAYNPYRLIADALWPLVLGPLGVALSFFIRGRATAPVVQRLGLVGCAASVILAVALLGWLGPRLAVTLRLLPPLAAALVPLVLLGAAVLFLYARSPRRIEHLRDRIG